MKPPNKKVWQNLSARQQQQAINLLVQMLLRQLRQTEEDNKS